MAQRLERAQEVWRKYTGAAFLETPIEAILMADDRLREADGDAILPPRSPGDVDLLCPDTGRVCISALCGKPDDCQLAALRKWQLSRVKGA